MEEHADAPGLPLRRYAWLLALSLLGLAGLLWIGVGGVALVQGRIFPGARSGISGVRAPGPAGTPRLARG